MPEPVVECYSGHTYAQEPRALIWQGHRDPVIRLEKRWRTPEGPAFCVGTASGNRFELQYHELEDRWVIRTLPEIDREGAKCAKILAFPRRFLRPDDSKTKDKEVRS